MSANDQPVTPYHQQTEALKAAADALKGGALVDMLTATSDEDLRRILAELEAAQRCLRGVLRERNALARRQAAWDARERAAGLVASANGSPSAN